MNRWVSGWANKWIQEWRDELITTLSIWCPYCHGPNLGITLSYYWLMQLWVWGLVKQIKLGMGTLEYRLHQNCPDFGKEEQTFSSHGYTLAEVHHMDRVEWWEGESSDLLSDNSYSNWEMEYQQVKLFNNILIFNHLMGQRDTFTKMCGYSPGTNSIRSCLAVAPVRC